MICLVLILLGGAYAGARDAEVIARGAYPDIAVDANGGVHAVYAREGVLYYKKRPKGGAWSDEQSTGLTTEMIHRSVPNRNSPPCILLRESYRDGDKVRKRTILNISHWPPEIIEGFRTLLKGGTAVSSLEGCFDIVRSKAHGHVAAVLHMIRRLKLDSLLGSTTTCERNLVIAMIIARILQPASKLALSREL